MVLEGAFADQLLALDAVPDTLSHLVLRNANSSLHERCAPRFAVSGFDGLWSERTNNCDGGAEYYDPMSVFFTSGTTGLSKGVLCSYAQAHATASPMARYMDEDDVFYMFNPLYHVALPHILGAVIISGGTLVLRPKFSASAFWQDIRSFGVTITMLLGGTAQFLYNQPETPDDRNHSLRKVLMVPLLRDMEAFTSRFDCKVMTWFNMTEVSTPLHSHGFTHVSGTYCGRPRLGVSVRIVDDNDESVPPGEVGELLVRTDDPWELSLGYWKDPTATVASWRNLWFHTGDLMTRDEDGNFYFVDRKKDAIRRRGENISSVEVEREILAHPSVAECAVVGLPAETGEEEVLAVVSVKQEHDLRPEELIDFLKPRMAAFMLPRFVYLDRSEIEKTPTGKVKKSALRDIRPDECWDAQAGSRSLAYPHPAYHRGDKRP